MPEMVFCKCGCGQLRPMYEKWGHRRRYYVEGHSTRINIPKEVLKKLYIDEKNPPKEIGEKLGCSPTVVRRSLKEYNIHIRTNSEAQKGKEWDEKKLPPVNLSMSDTMAYILGVIFGDGSVFKSSQGHYLIRLHVTSLDFIKSFKKALQSIGLNPSKIRRQINYKENQHDSFEISAFSKRFYKYFININIGTLEDEITKKRSLTFAWLRGFYESEGSIGKYNVNYGSKVLMVRMSNTDIEIINLVKKLLDAIDIKYSCYLGERKNPKHKNNYDIYIRGKSTEKQKFIEELDPIIKRCPV